MKRLLLTVCASVLVAACGEETPTGVGQILLPGESIETFEVILEADQYLVWDSSFGNYSRPSEVDLGILANAWGGSVDARVIVRYTLPRNIRVRVAGGSEQPDSLPLWFEGDIQIPMDTLVSPSGELSLHRSTETWDRESATWTLRVDTGGVALPWAVPGGSPGELAGTVAWATATDTAVLPVDSATIVAWADTTLAAGGGVISAGLPGTRMRIGPPLLRARARSTLNPDTVVEVTLTPIHTFIFTPVLEPQSSDIRVGGVPAWRGVLRFREDLDSITVPCPGEPGCRVRLDQVGVNFAAIQLQPVPSPAGFDPELPLEVALHLMLPTPNVPLQRSPISNPIAGTAEIPGSTFLAPGAPIVELGVTEVMRQAFEALVEGGPAPVTSVALLQSDTRTTFGFGTFAERPRLRLILTITKEMQLP
ncbi:MAG: hypothetical protein WEF86_03495 [Gemmatimonadota bacterium]